MSRWSELPDEVPLTAEEVLCRPFKRLGIGDVAVETPPTLLSVAGLGSCVSVFLSDTTSSYGAASHFMLPYGNPEADEDMEWRYIDDGLPQLVSRLCETAECDPDDVTAQIVGGGNVLALTKPSLHVGKQNIEAAQSHLEAMDVQVTGTHTGGSSARTVVFDPGTGVTIVANEDNGVDIV